MHDDTEDEEDKGAVWGRRKNIYYGADNVDYEVSPHFLCDSISLKCMALRATGLFYSMFLVGIQL